eukprot:gene8029-biopygen19942
MDWKKHKKLCKKLQAMHRAQPMPQQSEDGVAPGGGEGGGGGGAAGGRSSHTADEEDEIENPCPICLDNEDDATVDGRGAAICSACGQSYCGACNAGGLADRSPTCPTCRAPFTFSDESNFKRCWKLEHDRSAGRHTPVAQYTLGHMYRTGEGVEQDHVEAATWYRKAAEAGYAMAQNNLGNMYYNGKGVAQDHVEAAKWIRKAADAGFAIAQNNLGGFHIQGKGVEQDLVKGVKWTQLAAEQGFKDALLNLNNLQQANRIPTPPPATAVTTILLTSANAAKYNNRTGRVVEAPSPDMVRPSIAFVLLDGEAKPKMFKLMNLKIL